MKAAVITAALHLTTRSNKSSDEGSGYSHQKVMVALENLVLVVIAVAVAVAVALVVCSDNISGSGDDHGSHRAVAVAIDTFGF